MIDDFNFLSGLLFGTFGGIIGIYMFAYLDGGNPSLGETQYLTKEEIRERYYSKNKRQTNRAFIEGIYLGGAIVVAISYLMLAVRS